MNDNSEDDLGPSDFDNLRRHGDPEKRRETVAKLLEQLADLERGTNPLGGEDTAKDKGRRAFKALETAGLIVRLTAGWALDHQAGLALRRMNFAPAAPGGNCKHPEYLEARKVVDDHQLERDGASAQRWDGKPLGAAEARTLLFNLLHANPGAFPDRFQSTVMEALKALEFGEVLPLFEPDPAGKYRKVRYQEMQLQLWALALVEYRWAKWGRTAKLRAQNEVAEEYEVGTRTLREWQIPLRKELGRIMVDGVIGRARSCGDHAKKDKAFRLEHGDEIYGEKTLERAAERYKKLQANKAGAGAK